MQKTPYYVTLEELKNLVDEAYAHMLDMKIAYNQYKDAMDNYVHLRTKYNEELSNQNQLKLSL